MRTSLLWCAFLTAAVALGMPHLLKAEAQRQERECRRNMETVGAALEVYSADHPREQVGELVPDYLKAIPTCPAGTSYQILHSNGDVYTIVCGGWHDAAYTSTNGHLKGR